MSNISMENLTTMQKYWLITGSCGPRPVALVTSQNEDGQINVAPFSAFNYMGEDPPIFAIAITRYGEESHRPGELKDTLKNIIARSEFVVNMVDEPIADRMVKCGTDYPASISEADAVGFDLTPSIHIDVPRITEAPIAWECKLYKIFDFSGDRSIVFGEIVSMHFQDNLLNEETLRVNVDQFFPLGRLGGPTYVRTTDRVWKPIPTYLPSTGKPRV